MSVTIEDNILDVRNYINPLPIVETKKAIMKLDKGQILHVLTTDPGSELDFHHWARLTGHELLNYKNEDKIFHYWIRKKTE